MGVGFFLDWSGVVSKVFPFHSFLGTQQQHPHLYHYKPTQLNVKEGKTRRDEEKKS